MEKGSAFRPTHVVTFGGGAVAVIERSTEQGGYLYTAGEWPHAFEIDPEWSYDRARGMFRSGQRAEGAKLRPIHDLEAGDIAADEELDAVRLQLLGDGHAEAAELYAAALAGNAQARERCTQQLISGAAASRAELARGLGHIEDA